MGKRAGRRKKTRKEKIAESNRLKAEKKMKELPALSVDGKEVAEGIAAPEVIEKIRRA